MTTRPANQALKTAFQALSERARYAPPSGDAVSCRVIPTPKDTTPLAIGDAEVMRERVLFDVRVSEVPTPEVGGSFVLGGIAYGITLPPARLDAQKLVWTCDCSGAVPCLYRISSGANGDKVPPSGSAFKVAADAAAGATVLTIGGASLPTGKLMAGDAITIGADTYTVTASVSSTTATGNKFVNVPITPALAEPVTANTPVTLSFACDHPILVTPAAWTQVELAAGASTAERRLIIPHAVLAPFVSEPSTAHALVIGGVPKQVSTYSAIHQNGVPLVWDVKAKS